MAFEQSIKDQIRAEHHNAVRGTKGDVVKKYAEILQCSEKSVWAVIKTGRKRKKDTEKTKPLEDLTIMIHQIKYRGADGLKPLSTEKAVKIARKNNLLKEDDNYSISSINKMGKRLGLKDEVHRVQRFQAERPNQMHHVDASTSKYFYAHKQLKDGDYLLKLYGPSQNYKNKPTPLHQRVWVYGLVDDHSGYAVARYTVAPGEEAKDNYKFLEWAWMQTDDKPFFGLPEKIKADKGPMMRGKATEELFERLGVEIDPSVPGSKDAHGKIERPWITHAQNFERQFFVVDDWAKFEIKLSELTRQFTIYLNHEYNKRPHRYERSFTREQVWRRIHTIGGARPLPKDAFATAFKSIERTVQKDGTFSLDNNLYEVEGLFNARVKVLTSVFTGEMLVQDLATGEKYAVKDFKPNPLDTFTAHKDTPFQKNKKAGKDLRINKTLFEEEPQTTNIISLPTRVQQEQQFDTVFNSNSYPSVQKAMEAFSFITEIFPAAKSEERKHLEHQFMENKLSKAFVQEMAEEFRKYTRRCENG